VCFSFNNFYLLRIEQKDSYMHRILNISLPQPLQRRGDGILASPNVVSLTGIEQKNDYMNSILNIREQSRRDYRSVEKRNIAISSHAAGMRPAIYKRGCIPTECRVLREDAIFYRAIFPNGNGESRDYLFGASYAENPARNDQYVQPYKYNGKELDRMMELDYYDYSARMYDPIINQHSIFLKQQEKIFRGGR
jgi:hypothetical protein